MKIKNLIKNNFAKHVLTLLSGSTIAQVFTFIIMPVLTRIYSEELFGIYFIFVSTLNILKKITTLRFEIAIILPKKDSWAINAWAVTVFITFLTSIIFFAISLVFKKLILEISNLEKIANFIFLIPLSLFITGIFEAFNFWNNRIELYKKIAAGKISLSTTTGLSQLILGLKKTLNIGLIWGLVIGQIVSTITVILISIKQIFILFKNISTKKMKIILRKYYKIPMLNSVINVLINLANEIPIYLLTGFYSLSVSGFYGMANKIAATPMDLLARSVGQVFYQKASNDYNKGKDLKELVTKTYKNLFKISILPTIILIAATPFLPYILGEGWREATIYLWIIIPTVFINFITQPISGIFTITENQGKMLIFNIIIIIVKFFAIWSGYYFFKNVIISVILLSGVTVLYKIFILFWYLKISKTTNS
ncbi:MAG: oligosaccharide flippase family protein [Bacteroidales bacterium]|nr:oligosaccharide flippase family protein [Bacteroidales bacterium]